MAEPQGHLRSGWEGLGKKSSHCGSCGCCLRDQGGWKNRSGVPGKTLVCGERAGRGARVTEAPDTAADGLSAPAFPVGPGVALSLLSCIHRSPNKRPLAAATPSSLALASTAGWRPTNQNPLPQSPALTSWPLLPWALPVRGQSLREDVGIPFARVPPLFPSLPKAPGRWRPSPHH